MKVCTKRCATSEKYVFISVTFIKALGIIFHFCLEKQRKMSQHCIKKNLEVSLIILTVTHFIRRIAISFLEHNYHKWKSICISVKRIPVEILNQHILGQQLIFKQGPCWAEGPTILASFANINAMSPDPSKGILYTGKEMIQSIGKIVPLSISAAHLIHLTLGSHLE